MMERINLIWGGGARTCPGRHLAELVIFKVVPALLKDFDLKITAMPEESKMPYYFMAMLTGVKARFLPIGVGPRKTHDS
jgi:cytochrome P450